MIPFDIVYYRPDSITEAVSAFEEARSLNLEPAWLGGGTEIATFSRTGRIRPGALIDLKRIPECRAFELSGDTLVVGAALPLNRIADTEHFPLLSEACAAVADHTSRNRISLGGNIAGRLPYREAVLPLLVCEAEFVFAGPAGIRTADARQGFDGRLKTEPGEFLVNVRIDRGKLDGRGHFGRRERAGRIDYPLAAAAMYRTGDSIRCAVSGILPVPRRLDQAEAILSDSRRPAAERAAAAVESLPDKVREDFRASGVYRRRLLELILTRGLSELEG